MPQPPTAITFDQWIQAGANNDWDRQFAAWSKAVQDAHSRILSRSGFAAMEWQMPWNHPGHEFWTGVATGAKEKQGFIIHSDAMSMSDVGFYADQVERDNRVSVIAISFGQMDQIIRAARESLDQAQRVANSILHLAWAGGKWVTSNIAGQVLAFVVSIAAAIVFGINI